VEVDQHSRGRGIIRSETRQAVLVALLTKKLVDFAQAAMEVADPLGGYPHAWQQRT
jgi:hypothetical protein